MPCATLAMYVLCMVVCTYSRACAEDMGSIDGMAASNTHEHASGQAVEHASSQAGVGKSASEQGDTKSDGRLPWLCLLVVATWHTAPMTVADASPHVS